MRLSKLEAAAHLGISPTTVDRRIQRGELQAVKEPHGTRYRVWVILDDEPPEKPGGAPPGDPPDQPPTGAGQPHDSSGESPVSPAQISAFVEMARLQEQKKNAEDRAESLEERAKTLEELAEYHQKLLTDSEWRYQELLLELRQSQQNVAALTRALPAPKEDSAGEDPTAAAIIETPESRRQRRWWPFGRG